MTAAVTTHSARRRLVTLALSAAAPLVLLGASTQASAATPAATPAATSVVGSYTFYRQLYSEGGQTDTIPVTLNANHTCTGFSPNCTWTVSGTAFTLKFDNIRRGGIIYKGTLTSYGINTPTSKGHVYFGGAGYGNTPEGDWWAKKL